MPNSFSSSDLSATLRHAELYATCGSGLEHLLADELRELGLEHVQSAGAGVRFSGGLAAGYKACLWSRVANRVLIPIHQGAAATPEALYELVQEIDWSLHVDVDGSLAVDFFTAKSAITHSQYGALKVKDAVVDQFRESSGRRPDVDRDTPDLRINVYLFRDKARIAIDLSGSSLHRRGYRDAGGLAPLKENLAAALLLAAGWPAALEQGQPLADPMCGSGTLLIEAAMMACRQAPGLLRDYFGFMGWKGHDEALWQDILLEARQAVRPSPVAICGSDHDRRAIDNCRQNLQNAGLADVVSLDVASVSDRRPPLLDDAPEGLLISNPPYGERLAGDARFYADLGSSLSREYAGWQCALFTAEAAPHARARLPLSKTLKATNGGIDCVLLTGEIPRAGKARLPVASHAAEGQDGMPGAAETGAGLAPAGSSADMSADSEADSDSPHPQASLYRGPREALEVDATPFANRLKKNLRALKGWKKQSGVKAYRVYDSDLPEFAVAIDLFESEQLHCVVQEYQAPSTVNRAMAEARLEALMAVLPETLNVESDCVHLKVREVKSGTQQYEKLQSASSSVSLVEEFGAQLEVNFTDYLDTGLFLDHRPVRRYIWKNSQGKRFLNLFAYTATATVASVMGGASSSVSVDTSNRYCQWAMRNLDRNGAAQQLHEVVRQDVISWLEHASVGIREEALFDLILLDPPTFSNSSAVEDDWNVQRDHVSAIDACLKLLAPGGTLIFSNNYRRFKLSPELTEDDTRGIRVEERNSWSIDRDFQRNPRIHQCWFIHKP
ncbi:bifunctional 23S rRNA (guanine(2069)-N(7))-methyltransferase RlmK/23S rRNA (guanine(2445)-N(2))-methyltransferase RlmL [Granulosicoccus sp. 3-233]|uniref:bifunctional 23S rRNA (guanine(2069)-N(7))-methyltransferase RlmK/23S rRNA (guanine(2445)-N(2))-methyltransferase RlmL n=1 Tax=Granulosicoccus sp. 3-233 TaxID=3417969 RepID=UPI003D346426